MKGSTFGIRFTISIVAPIFPWGVGKPLGHNAVRCLPLLTLLVGQVREFQMRSVQDFESHSDTTPPHVPGTSMPTGRQGKAVEEAPRTGIKLIRISNSGHLRVVIALDLNVFLTSF